MAAVAQEPDRLRRYAGPGIILGICILVVLVYAHGYPGVIGVPRTDQGVFLIEGDGILHGKTPYVDLWDHKGLLLYFLNALGLIIGGGNRIGVLLLEAGLAMLAYCLAFKTLAKHFGRIAAGVGVSVTLMFSVITLNDANQAETWALLAGLLAIPLFDRYLESNSPWPALGLGMCGASQFMMRPNMCGMFLSCAFVICLLRIGRKEFGPLLKSLAQMALGIVVVLAPLFLYLVEKGAFAAFVDCYFTFNIAYVKASASSQHPIIGSDNQGSRWDTFVYAFNLWDITWFAAAGWFIAARAGFKHFQGQAASPIVLLGLVAFPVEIIASCISRFQFEHYFIAWAAPMTILITLLFNRVEASKAFQQFGPRLGLALACLGVSFFVFLDIQSETFGWIMNPGPDRANRMAFDEYLDCVRTYSKPGDAVFFWGFEATVNYFTGRRLASRYLSHVPLITPGYASEPLFEQFDKDIRASRPTLIIDAAGNMIYDLHNSPFPAARDLCSYILADYRYGQLKTGQWFFVRRT